MFVHMTLTLDPMDLWVISGSVVRAIKFNSLKVVHRFYVENKMMINK